MNCPLCDTPGATEKHVLDWTVLKCTQCGEIKFTDVAFIDLAQLDANQKRRVRDYCSDRMSRSEVITDLRIKKITEESLNKPENASEGK